MMEKLTLGICSDLKQFKLQKIKNIICNYNHSGVHVAENTASIVASDMLLIIFLPREL